MILLAAEPTITIDFIVKAGIAFIGFWGFLKVVLEVVEVINKRHDREQKWDDYSENLEKERNKIYEKYDERLYEVEKQIANNSTDTDAKIQDIKAEITILTKSMSAILDGLIQQGCNGSVTEAKKNLDEFLMSKL